MPEMPKRRNQLTIDVHADSLEDLRSALEEVSRQLREDGNVSTTGGYTWGGHWEHRVMPEQTHDRFAKQLDVWLEAQVKEGA